MSDFVVFGNYSANGLLEEGYRAIGIPSLVIGQLYMDSYDENKEIKVVINKTNGDGFEYDGAVIYTRVDHRGDTNVFIPEARRIIFNEGHEKMDTLPILSIVQALKKLEG